MTDSANFDFAPVLNDYEYFLAHSTERDAQIEALKPRIIRQSEGRPTLRMLDFGCGTGKFTEQLLKQSGLPAGRIQLSLVEPVEDHLAMAAERLAPWIRESSRVSTTFEPGEQYDFILANHSLYYVADLPGVLVHLLESLSDQSLMVAAMLDKDNTLARLWQAAFEQNGQQFPFSLAENVESLIRSLGHQSSRERIDYRIRFPNKLDAKECVLKFLLGEHWDKLPHNRLVRMFDPLHRGGVIYFETHYPHLVVHANTDGLRFG